MNSLCILNETYTNGYRSEILDIISLLAILSGILVIVSKNPIVSVLFLVGLFLSIASYLMMLGLNFIGISYLLVYVGAVSILFLFILMLINVRISELLSNTRNGIALAIFILIAFYYTLYPILPYSIISLNSVISFNSNTEKLDNTWNSNFNNTENVNYTWNSLISNTEYVNHISNSIINKLSDSFLLRTDLFKLNGSEAYNGEISFATSKVWDSNLAETSHITSIGNIMYTSYSIWLILTSIILLLAMVGAIVITIKPKNQNHI